jgi:hypothetical protein
VHKIINCWGREVYGIYFWSSPALVIYFYPTVHKGHSSWSIFTLPSIKAHTSIHNVFFVHKQTCINNNEIPKLQIIEWYKLRWLIKCMQASGMPFVQSVQNEVCTSAGGDNVRRNSSRKHSSRKERLQSKWFLSFYYCNKIDLMVSLVRPVLVFVKS